MFYQKHAGDLFKSSRISRKKSGILKIIPVSFVRDTLFRQFFTCREAIFLPFSYSNPVTFNLPKSKVNPASNQQDLFFLPRTYWSNNLFLYKYAFYFLFDKPQLRENRIKSNKPVLRTVQLSFKAVELTKCQNVNLKKNGGILKEMKKLFFTLLVLVSSQMGIAQSLEKMQWFNEPEEWEIKDNSLSMFVTPQSDYWRISHYGFTVDDAPFYYTTYGGEFEVKVKVTGDYKQRFDQAGLMLRIDHENYIKTGIEFVDGKFNISTVVTHKTSDWSVIALDKPVPYIWIKAVRRLDAVEIFYSLDDKEYTMMRTAWLQDNIPVMVGLMAASPDGKGFKATFEHFKVKHFPDCRRLEWLKKNTEEQGTHK